MENGVCEHMNSISDFKQPRQYACEECVKTGSHWVHLRTCQTCGITLCCDSSPNKHMTKHFHQTNHPVVVSAEPGERWMYCYIDHEMAEY